MKGRSPSRYPRTGGAVSSGLRELNKVRELLFKHLGDVGLDRNRCDRHSHDDRAAAERPWHDANVSAAALAVRHFAKIVHRTRRRVQEDLEPESLAILADATVRFVDPIDGVGEDRGPLGNVGDVCQHIIELAWFKIGFNGAGYGLGFHKSDESSAAFVTAVCSGVGKPSISR